MLGNNSVRVVDAPIPLGATFSTAVNIDGANKIGLELPTFDVGSSTDSCNVYATVCDTRGGTYRRVKDMGAYSASSGIQDWEVPSTIGNYTVVCRPVVGFNFMKIEVSVSASAGIAARVHVIN